MNVYLDLVGEYEEDREVYIFRVRLLLLTEEVAEHDEAFVRWEAAASFVLRMNGGCDSKDAATRQQGRSHVLSMYIV